MKAHEALRYFYQHSEKISGHLVIKSEVPGKKTLIFGGTHGNEPGGVHAIIKVHKLLKANPQLIKSGEIHLILGNPEAFIQDTRFIHQDLNRLFHHPQGNSIEASRAREIIQLFSLIAPIDAVLDLHTVSKGNYQIMIYNAKQENALQVADQFSPIDIHLKFDNNQMQGFLIDKTEEFGASLRYAVECGNHTDPKAGDVAYGKILSFLNYNGHLNPTAEILHYTKVSKSKEQIILYDVITPIFPGPGFYFLDSDIKTGSFCPKGSVYAKSNLKEYIAPVDSYTVMPPQNVQPDDFDAGFLCTKKILTRS